MRAVLWDMDGTLVDSEKLWDEAPESVEEYFKLGYRGARFSFGYGACPDLKDRAKMMELLEPERIGVTLYSPDRTRSRSASAISLGSVMLNCRVVRIGARYLRHQ